MSNCNGFTMNVIVFWLIYWGTIFTVGWLFPLHSIGFLLGTIFTFALVTLNLTFFRRSK